MERQYGQISDSADTEYADDKTTLDAEVIRREMNVGYTIRCSRLQGAHLR